MNTLEQVQKSITDACRDAAYPIIVQTKINGDDSINIIVGLTKREVIAKDLFTKVAANHIDSMNSISKNHPILKLIAQNCLKAADIFLAATIEKPLENDKNLN